MMSAGMSWPALFLALLKANADLKGKSYSGEKTPVHALHVRTLCEWFPDCSIIHLVRDPRSMLGALKRMPWATHSALMSARMWRLLNAAASAVSTRNNYLMIKYEDLATHPEEQLHRLCTHIGLEYSDALLHPDPAEIADQPEHQRSYQEITSSRIALWREELKPWQVSAIESIAGPDMAKYGYNRDTIAATPWDMTRATAEAAKETALQLLVRSPSILYGIFRPANLADEQKWTDRASELTRRLRSLPPRT
jgi:hypothetical protein